MGWFKYGVGVKGKKMKNYEIACSKHEDYVNPVQNTNKSVKHNIYLATFDISITLKFEHP